jgi:hypothetical protein
LSVPNKGYSRKVLYAPLLISTFFISVSESWAVLDTFVQNKSNWEWEITSGCNLLIDPWYCNMGNMFIIRICHKYNWSFIKKNIMAFLHKNQYFQYLMYLQWKEEKYISFLKFCIIFCHAEDSKLPNILVHYHKQIITCNHNALRWRLEQTFYSTTVNNNYL